MNSLLPCAVCTTPDVCREGIECALLVRSQSRAAQAAVQADARQKLADFGAAVLKLHRADAGLDIYGDTLEAMAEKAGVLEQRTVTEPCGEGCVCAAAENIPGRCFFVPDAIQQLLPKD